MSAGSLPERTRLARALVELAGANPRRYVPGTPRIQLGGSMTWDEDNGRGPEARTLLIPTGPVDADLTDQTKEH